MGWPITDGGPVFVIPEPPTVVWGTLHPPQVKAASDVSPPRPTSQARSSEHQETLSRLLLGQEEALVALTTRPGMWPPASQPPWRRKPLVACPVATGATHQPPQVP